MGITRPTPQTHKSVLAAVVLALTASVLSIGGRAETPPASGKAPFVRPLPAAGSAKAEEGGKRLREGTRVLDLEGRFEFTGDRMAFFRIDTEETYKILENLALERINKVLEETRASEKPHWIVSGTVTEYHGANYLLVSKAVIKAQTAAPLPSRGGSDRPDSPPNPAATRPVQP